jgi:hypothetical protein
MRFLIRKSKRLVSFSKYCLFVLSPLLVAIGIYIAFRSQLPPLLLKFINWVSLEQPIYGLGLSWGWLVYNLPDGLWSFSFTNFIMLSTQENSHAVRNFYLSVGIFLMVASEIAQGTILSGTYDPLDIVAISLGTLVSFMVLKNSNSAASAQK